MGLFASWEGLDKGLERFLESQFFPYRVSRSPYNPKIIVPFRYQVELFEEYSRVSDQWFLARRSFSGILTDLNIPYMVSDNNWAGTGMAAFHVFRERDLIEIKLRFDVVNRDAWGSVKQVNFTEDDYVFEYIAP